MKPWPAALLVSSLLAAEAGAQGRAPAPSEPWTARKARVIVSAERLFGIHAHSSTYEPSEGDTTTVSGVMVSLLYGHSTINSEDDRVNPYAVPRLAVDAVLQEVFTIGASAGFVATAGEIDTGSSRDLPGVTGFALHGRLGYLLVPNAGMALWLRAGPEFFSGSYDDAGAQVEYLTKALALTIDPQLVITPVPHAAILVGPLINIGVWGSYERRFLSSSEQVDFRISNLGITAGLALLF